MKKLLFVLCGAVAVAAADLSAFDRAEALRWFGEHQFGVTPIGRPADESFGERSVSCLGGQVKIDITCVLPDGADATHPAPVFLFGDHKGGKPPDFLLGDYDGIPTNAITARGYAYVRWNFNNVAPNVNVNDLWCWPRGVISVVATGDANNTNVVRGATGWGTIGAWAWGHSRVMDWIETRPELDASRVAVVGHSRGGKTALWAGAQDTRFAMVVSNGSGCGGAKLARFGLDKAEKFRDILQNFPNWFCPAFAEWIDRDAEITHDADDLMRLVAPRLLYVASGSEDEWAGPAAEKAAWDAAHDVWKAAGLECNMGYHVHQGPHKLRPDDWEKFLDFADRRMKRRADGVRRDGWIDFNKNGRKDVYEDPSAGVEARVADLLSQMTLEEKTCQLATLYGSGRVLKDAQPTAAWKNEIWKDGIGNIDEELNGVGKMYATHFDLIYPFSNHVAAVNAIQKWFVEETRLGIPVDFSNEGIHGLNHTKATPFPAPIGIGATWSRALVRRAGEIVGEEARLIGYSNVYAPILDVARDPRWGRTLECYGEDPFLVAELGKEMTLGIQSQGVASTLKHYAAYGVPKGGRDGSCRTDPHITPRELHEIFLYPFRRVVREAKPMGVMCSYNDWNGEPVASSRWFLTDLLRGEYGFDGYVVSDSEAVEFVQTKHAVAETYEEACAQVLEAGLNVRTHFTPPEDFILPVRAAVKSGRLPMSIIDKRTAEVLSVKFRLGLFDNPYTGDRANADALAGFEKHRDFADAIQAESFVLLKNDGVLPLDRSRIRKVLVAGPLAADESYMVSRYGPNGNKTVTILDGLRASLGEGRVVYAKGCETVDANWPESEIVHEPLTAQENAEIESAVAAAEGADAIIAVLGEDEQRCGESRSRTSLDFPGRQQILLERLHATGRPVVLVLVNGQPLTVNWAEKNVAAILEVWFPGACGGTEVAKTLFGERNPSGRLPVTFPKSIGQIEYNFPFKKGSHGRQPRNDDPNGTGKTRVQGALYPFGYGLSYTTFEYANLEIGKRGAGWTVSCDVTNTGARPGAEVVQLYIRDMYASVVTYDSVLRGFEKVWLEPGETRRVVFGLKPDDLAILDRRMRWTVEPGDFEVRIGASSEDIRLRAVLSVGTDCQMSSLH